MVVVLRRRVAWLPSILLFIALSSESHDDIFLANFANTNVANYLNRVEGVSQARVLNARNYSIKWWTPTDA
jgi:multidrug efflux pump subunit AcrB